MPIPNAIIGSEYNAVRNLAYKSLKSIVTDKIQLHPAAVTAFEWYITVPQATPWPEVWLEPLLAVRQAGRLLVFAGFATWKTAPGSESLPLAVVSDVSETVIERTAWEEVLRLAYGQLNGFHGHARVVRAIRAVPQPFRVPTLGSTTDNALATLLGVDPSRFKRKGSK